MYTIDERTFETAEDAAQHVIDNVDLTYEYDELLDERYEDFTPSEVLRKVDESAYQSGYLDFVGGVYSDMVYDLAHMASGDTFFTVDDYEVVYTEDDITD